MSHDPQMAGVVILLALVFLVLLVARAVIEARRHHFRPRATRWARERPEGPP